MKIPNLVLLTGLISSLVVTTSWSQEVSNEDGFQIELSQNHVLITTDDHASVDIVINRSRKYQNRKISLSLPQPPDGLWYKKIDESSDHAKLLILADATATRGRHHLIINAEAPGKSKATVLNLEVE